MNYKTFRVLLILYMALILGVSTLPGDSLPKTWLLNWDKLIHLFEYFFLGILAMMSLKNTSITSSLGVILFGILFGRLIGILLGIPFGNFL